MAKGFAPFHLIEQTLNYQLQYACVKILQLKVCYPFRKYVERSNIKPNPLRGQYPAMHAISERRIRVLRETPIGQDIISNQPDVSFNFALNSLPTSFLKVKTVSLLDGKSIVMYCLLMGSWQEEITLECQADNQTYEM